MFGIHFMKRAPFARVLLHGMVVDETGDKMSKVKGNVIDPLDLVYGSDFRAVVAKSLPGAPETEALSKFKKAYPSAAQMGAGFPAFGADALRYTLATFPPSNKRIALAPKRIEGYRHFVNKIWNATRLSLDLLGPGRTAATPSVRRARTIRTTGGSLLASSPARRSPWPTAGSRGSASTTRRTISTASSGTTSATGTWRSRRRCSATPIRRCRS